MVTARRSSLAATFGHRFDIRSLANALQAAADRLGGGPAAGLAHDLADHGPRTPRLPPRILSTRSGLAATTRATTASSSPVSKIWARPLRCQTPEIQGKVDRDGPYNYW
jgi:hypothetical protein